MFQQGKEEPLLDKHGDEVLKGNQVESAQHAPLSSDYLGSSLSL